MSTYIAVYEEDGEHPAGRLIAASAEPDVVVEVAQLLLDHLPVSDSPIVEEPNRGRRRALEAVLDVAAFLSTGSHQSQARAKKERRGERESPGARVGGAWWHTRGPLTIPPSHPATTSPWARPRLHREPPAAPPRIRSVSWLFQILSEPARRYLVRDDRGRLLAVLVRTADKTMWWLQPDGRPGLGGLHPADFIYGSERLSRVPLDVPVVTCEGPKDTEACWRAGLAAVGTLTGAGGVPSCAALEVLRDRIVVLWPDADNAGEAPHGADRGGTVRHRPGDPSGRRRGPPDQGGSGGRPRGGDPAARRAGPRTTRVRR